MRAVSKNPADLSSRMKRTIDVPFESMLSGTAIEVFQSDGVR
jgi:hypothetical protein